MSLVRFPARVTLDDGTPVADRCKVFQLGADVAVFEVVAGAVTETHRLAGATSTGTAAGGRAVRFAGTDGTVWLVSKGAGCGCGSPLKRFDPRSRPYTSGT